MSILERINPEIRRGLGPATVRLILREPEPERQPYQTDKVVIEDAHVHQAAMHQLNRKLVGRSRKKPRRRG